MHAGKCRSWVPQITTHSKQWCRRRGSQVSHNRGGRHGSKSCLFSGSNRLWAKSCIPFQLGSVPWLHHEMLLKQPSTPLVPTKVPEALLTAGPGAMSALHTEDHLRVTVGSGVLFSSFTGTLSSCVDSHVARVDLIQNFVHIIRRRRRKSFTSIQPHRADEDDESSLNVFS